MVKTNKQKKQKQNKTKKISGGRPKFIKMYAQHTEKGNVVYRFVYDDFNEEDQQKIIDEDKVYYSVKNDDSLMDELKNQIDVLNEEVRSFFYRKPLFKSKNKDSKTIIIRNKKELSKIKIAEQLIANMNSANMNSVKGSQKTYDKDIPAFIKEYKKFINTNKGLLLDKIILVNTAWKMLNTPAFLNIIGKRYRFIQNDLKVDMDELQEQMDSTTTSAIGATTTSAISATTTGTTATSAPTQATVPKSRAFTQRLKNLVKSK